VRGGREVLKEVRLGGWVSYMKVESGNVRGVMTVWRVGRLDVRTVA